MKKRKGDLSQKEKILKGDDGDENANYQPSTAMRDLEKLLDLRLQALPFCCITTYLLCNQTLSLSLSMLCLGSADT
jgi:hypothetical protein